MPYTMNNERKPRTIRLTPKAMQMAKQLGVPRKYMQKFGNLLPPNRSIKNAYQLLDILENNQFKNMSMKTKNGIMFRYIMTRNRGVLPAVRTNNRTNNQARLRPTRSAPSLKRPRSNTSNTASSKRRA